ncbi:MAG: glycoside hydrolase family 3 C-terminal domain-containing protein [Elusimicrobia bacterium]|nr:glycoside hydrolase family 3 C-terminal domain-containing protein [Elusimicrobiota bacterium]
MKKYMALAAALLCVSSSLAAMTDAEAQKQAKKIVSKMTLEEKIGQMTQITLDVIMKGTDNPPSNTLEVDMDKLREAVVKYHVGSILNSPENRAKTAQWWNDAIAKMQSVAMNETRMKVPIVYGLDQMHGTTYTAGGTLFPQQIGLAATWDPSHARKQGEITAYETRASNVPWVFAPVLDLGQDPRFPRQYEDFGEDPYLASVFGSEIIKGLQGDNMGAPDKVTATLKHFLGYSAPFSGKDRTPAVIPWHALLEYHVPPFQAGVDAGAGTAMINSGLINGEPVHSSKKILTDLLRGKMGFKGMVVTDWEDINKLYNRDRIATSVKDAIRIAINAGIDMSMVPMEYKEFCGDLKELVQEGKVKMSRVDDAATKVVALKLKLNLFDKPNTFLKDYPNFHSAASQQASYDTAADSITLLKNDNNILPLKKGTKIFAAGPNATDLRPIFGGWTRSWQGEKIFEFKQSEGFITMLDALKEKFGAANVTFEPGVSYIQVENASTDNNAGSADGEYKDGFDKAVAAAKKADVIVLFLGENSYAEKPGDVNDLYLSDLQTELAKAMIQTGKKVILVLSEGRPRVISKFVSGVNAVVQTYLPGPYGPAALADILAGDVNPSGKLPYTYPAFPNSLVPYYHKYADEQSNADVVYTYKGDFNPEFPFGFGLSYTTFKYGGLTIDKSSLPLNSKDEITLSVDVTNTGGVEGKEVVQLYSSTQYASLTPDVKRLRRFEKISLKPGETQTVTFKLKLDDISFINLDDKRVVEPGDIIFSVGSSSRDIQSKVNFTVK